MAGMDIVTVVVIVVVVLVVLALGGVLLSRSRTKRSEHLQERFGPEYDQAEREQGSRRKAEHELADREQRHEQLEIRDLDPGRRQEYADEWRRVQSQFVDQPLDAVKEADGLVRTVMDDRGYPTDDAQRQAEGLSVEHPEVMDDYRAATAITDASRTGTVTTEQLREAMLHYRSLFARLLGGDAHG